MVAARCVALMVSATWIALGSAAAQAVADSYEAGSVTFTKDVAPILQENCVQCHRQGGVGPMSLETYEQARRYAMQMKHRTGLRDRAGAMPPFYLERDIGIQHYRDVLMLSDGEIATIAAWAENGAPRGDPADMPPPRQFDDHEGWAFQPDIVVRTRPFTMGANEPDKFVPIPGPDGVDGRVAIGLTEDRYVAAVQVREINDVPQDYQSASSTGGRWIVHHLTYSTAVPGEERDGVGSWPVHELGRNADIFPADEGRLLRAGSEVRSGSLHLSSNGRETTAHLEIGFKFFPADYRSPYERPIRVMRYGNGFVHDVEPGKDDNLLTRSWVLEDHMKLLSSEAHLHAAGWRMCLEAIWGNFEETLWCIGYDHNWVRNYWYDEDAQPLLPKGTILRVTAELNNTESNPNVVDPRNWSGPGSITRSNMFHLFSVEVPLTDEEFTREMTERVERLDLGPNDWVIGCPLCKATIPPPPAKPADLEHPLARVSAVSDLPGDG